MTSRHPFQPTLFFKFVKSESKSVLTEGNIYIYVHTDILKVQGQEGIMKKKDQKKKRMISALFMPCDFPES